MYEWTVGNIKTTRIQALSSPIAVLSLEWNWNVNIIMIICGLRTHMMNSDPTYPRASSPTCFLILLWSNRDWWRERSFCLLFISVDLLQFYCSLQYWNNAFQFGLNVFFGFVSIIWTVAACSRKGYVYPHWLYISGMCTFNIRSRIIVRLKQQQQQQKYISDLTLKLPWHKYDYPIYK